MWVKVMWDFQMEAFEQVVGLLPLFPCAIEIRNIPIVDDP